MVDLTAFERDGYARGTTGEEVRQRLRDYRAEKGDSLRFLETNLPTYGATPDYSKLRFAFISLRRPEAKGTFHWNSEVLVDFEELTVWSARHRDSLLYDPSVGAVNALSPEQSDVLRQIVEGHTSNWGQTDPWRAPSDWAPSVFTDWTAVFYTSDFHLYRFGVAAATALDPPGFTDFVQAFLEATGTTYILTDQ